MAARLIYRVLLVQTQFLLNAPLPVIDGNVL